MRRHRFAQVVPLLSGGETCPAAPPQLGRLDLLDDHLRGIVDEHLVQRLVTAHCHILFHIVRVDKAAIAQNDLFLPFEEGNVLPGRNGSVPGSVLDLRRKVIPLLNLAQREVRRDFPHHHVVQDFIDVVALHPPQDHQGAAGEPDVDEGFLGAKTEAPHTGQLDVQPALINTVRKSVEDGFRAIAGAAGAHAYGKPRPERLKLPHAGASNCGERTQIPDARHCFAFSLPR